MSASLGPREARARFAWWRWRRLRLPSTPHLLEAVAIGLGLVLFIVLGRLYSAAPFLGFDEGGLALTRAARSPALDAIVQRLTMLGAEALWFIWPPIVLLLLARRRVASAVAVTVVALGVHVWNDVLKALYQRARPSDLEGALSVQSFSFPSGHAMAAGAVYGILALIAWRELGGRARRIVIGLCCLLAATVAVSRVYLGVHYPTDVVAGLAAGAVWAHVVVLGWRLAVLGWLRVRG